jgi:hypothetical protein
MNTHAATNPPMRRREYMVIALTTLILSCAVVAVASNLLPLATVAQKNTKIKEPNRPTIEARTANNNVTVTQPRETEPVGTHGGITVSPVRDSEQRTPTEAEPQEPLVAASGHAAARLKSNLAPYSGSPFSEFVGPIIFTMAAVFTLAIVAILVLVLGVLGLLRWHSQRFGPLIRIECVGTPPIAVDSFKASSPAVHPSMQTTRPTDFGPSFVQEHQSSESLEASVNRPQDPLVQRLFEEALQLQTQIDLAREEQQGQKVIA